MKINHNEVEKQHALSRLTRLMISGHDFQQALSATTFLLHEVDESSDSLANLRKFRCYETTMVVAYARPFSMANGEIKPLKWRDTGLANSSSERSLHDRLIKHRNTIYGHSDAEFVEMRVTVMHQKFDHNGVDFNMLLPRFSEDLRFSSTEVESIAEMLHKLIHTLFFKIQELGVEFKDRYPTFEMGVGRKTKSSSSKRG